MLFAFEFIWGNTNSVGFINAGYSTFSFIGIYILAGLLRKIEVNKRYNCSAYFSIFIISTAINSILYIAAVNKNIRIEHIIFNYINPLIILGAASLLALFTKLRESYSVSINKTILWFSSSCFAVYLLHVGTGYALELFCDGTRAIYFSNSGLKAFILILLYMACVFIAAIIIDQPRKLIWKKHCLHYLKIMSKPRIIILMHYLELGGAEMSLIGLLGALDPGRVDVDLFIYSHRGPLMRFIPKWVNLLPEIPAYAAIESPLTQAARKGHLMVAIGRLAARMRHLQWRRRHPAEGDDGAIMQYVGNCVTPGYHA